jgi:hypothetical protein
VALRDRNFHVSAIANLFIRTPLNRELPFFFHDAVIGGRQKQARVRIAALDVGELPRELSIWTMLYYAPLPHAFLFHSAMARASPGAKQ